jgi:hypothetical protein
MTTFVHPAGVRPAGANLVDQLAGALSAAETSGHETLCLDLQAINGQARNRQATNEQATNEQARNVSTPPPLPYITAEDAQEVFAPRDFLVEQYFDAHPIASSPANPWPDAPVAIGDDEHFDALPRLFYRARAAKPQAPLATPGWLSGTTMAFGFAIGLALTGPMLMVKLKDKGARTVQPAVAQMFDATLITALVPTSAAIDASEKLAAPAAGTSDEAQAAFEEAGRRISNGDYIGARDYLRRAVAAGEERARALLKALD